MRRALAPLLSAMIACTSSVPTSVTLRAADLPEVALQASEAPEGLEFRVRQSGPENLERFGRPGEQRTTLATHGFTGAYRVSLSTDAYLDNPSDPRYWTGIDLVENQVVVLKDAGAADAVLEYYRELTVRKDQSPDMQPVEALGLGEEAYGLTGRIVGVAPSYIFYWRRGNVFASITVVGTKDGVEERAGLGLDLARAVDDRIAARA